MVTLGSNQHRELEETRVDSCAGIGSDATNELANSAALCFEYSVCVKACPQHRRPQRVEHYTECSVTRHQPSDVYTVTHSLHQQRKSHSF
jgi:hypothetical protein